MSNGVEGRSGRRLPPDPLARLGHAGERGPRLHRAHVEALAVLLEGREREEPLGVALHVAAELLRLLRRVPVAEEEEIDAVLDRAVDLDVERLCVRGGQSAPDQVRCRSSAKVAHLGEAVVLSARRQGDGRRALRQRHLDRFVERPLRPAARFVRRLPLAEECRVAPREECLSRRRILDGEQVLAPGERVVQVCARPCPAGRLQPEGVEADRLGGSRAGVVVVEAAATGPGSSG